MLTADDHAEIVRLRRHLLTLLGDGNKHVLEPGKDFALSITGPGIIGAENTAIEAQMKAYQAECDGFDMIWTYSISAIGIAPKGINKRTGAAYLLDRHGIAAHGSFAIGDSIGDIPVLSFVHHALCPANADPMVREICSFTAKESTTPGGYGNTGSHPVRTGLTPPFSQPHRAVT